MKWLIKFFLKNKGLLMKFTLIDYNDIAWEISMDEVHTIFEDAYTIYIVYTDKSYKSFPSIPKNRSNLPAIKLASPRVPN